MEARELRLGNYVDINGEVISIKSIDFDELHEDTPIYYIHGGHELERCDPITLTEEWLQKFGFIKNDNVYWELFRYEIHYHKGIRAWCFNVKSQRSVDLLEYGIKYVHQLQTLYFALTGEELTTSQ